MIPQQGLASLPQAQQGPMQGGPMQGPMPGQAPMQQMPGMMPQQGAPTPGAMTGSLKNMPLEQLKMLYQNPQPGSPPLWAVISALAEKQKEAQAMQAAQGQQVMAQNQQMQQQPPVAAQVMQAAEQMEPQAYAGGGAVAFQSGGIASASAADYQLARKYGIDLSPYDPPSVREEKIKRARAMAGFDEQRKSFGEIPRDTSNLFPFGPPESPMMPVPEIQVRPPAPAPAAGPARTQRRQPAATPDTGIGNVNPYRGLAFNPDTAVGPEVSGRTGLAALEAADVEAAQKQLTQDPTVKAAQDALLKNMQDTADTRRTRAQQQLDEVLKRGRTSVLEDPEALLRIAAGIDTRRGKGIGSLAGGVSGVMGERRKEAADAKTLFNKEMDALDTMKQLQLERDLLIKQGRVTEAQAAEAKLRAVRKEYEGIRYTREVKQADEARQQFVAESGRMSAEASQEQARAATKVANARVAGVGEKPTTPYQLAQLRDKARDNLKETLPMILIEAKRAAAKANVPFDRQAAENEAIDREMERLMPGLSGKKPTTAPAPGQLSPDVLSQFKVRPVGQ